MDSGVQRLVNIELESEPSMPVVNYDGLRSDASFLQHVGSDIWIMDDHRWANLVWERRRTQERSCLVHADYHWDAVDDFAGHTELVSMLTAASVEDIARLIEEDTYIGFDSFIAPAVRRNLFSEVHFYCREDDSNEVGLSHDLLREAGTVQVIHKTTNTLVSYPFRHPIIFDLCLDLFNDSDEWETGDLWGEAEIVEFLDVVQTIIRRALVVTVSLSFGYSGTVDDTRRLARLVIPKLLEVRQ